jgi:RNA polymerase sigma factor (sigma-70 family)
VKPRTDRTVWPKFEDHVGQHETASASADGLSDKGDRTLVAAAKNENRQAFEILVERHARRAFFAARRITRTREDAEDIVQQSLQKAFIHLRQFEGKSSFSTWLTRIAINEALMMLRKRRGLNDPISDRRIQRASEAVNFAAPSFAVQQYFFGAAKRARYRKHGSATLAARFKGRSSGPPSRYKSVRSASFGASLTLAPVMHFLPA